MNKFNSSKRTGFTLIELAVVIAIIGLLSTVVFIGTPTIMTKARDARITQDFHKLLNLAEKINLDKGSYDPLCEGSLPCDEDVQKIYEDISKRKGTLVIQKSESPAQSYCAFSPLNSLTEENQTQYYCIDGAGGKIKTAVNPGLEHCIQDSFNCPTQLVLREGEEGFVIPPLTASLQVFRVSTKEYPYFKEVAIDPLDVRVGDIQIMLVEIEDPDEISWIRSDIEHDNGYDTVMLTLIEGDLSRGIWGGQWKVHDTHLETYHTIFTAQNRKGKQSSITLAWTDPCSPPVSGNWSLSEGGGSCVMNTNEVHGLENGVFTVDSGTITISEGATWVFNPGQSIKLTGGSIAISKTGVGGQIRKTYLWMVDADSDHYASSTISSQYYGLTAPTVGGVTLLRRNTMTSYACLDYDDRNPSIYYGTACEESSDAATDTYSDETKIDSKSNLTVTGGQVKSELGP